MEPTSRSTLSESFAIGLRDQERAADLRRMKLFATGVLAFSFTLLIVSRILERRYPGFSYLSAFAEASTIGGLADWYAVVVLFRHPFGLPIPHTAIIPENQQRIAEKLGEFIETHFLAPEPVQQKMREVDFARFASDWLSDPAKAEALAQFILRLLPDMLDTLEHSSLRTFATRRIVAQLQSLDLRPFAAGALNAFTEGGRHQQLLDDLLSAFSKLIHEPETLAALQGKIRDELPSLLRIYRADAYLLKRIVASVGAFFDEVRADPEHPFRSEFDRFIRNFVEQISTSADYERRLDDLKRLILTRPEFAGLAKKLWDTIRTFVEDSAAGRETMLRTHLVRLLTEAGKHLGRDAEMRAEVNAGMVVVLTSFVESQKSGVSRFIADQVKSWDVDQLVELIEINVGRDLQYIRLNGALIGGLAGLVLHAVQQALRIG